MNYPTVTRLDVSFVVLWQTNSLILPIFDHWNLVVLILRFIEGDTRKGLVYKNRGNKEFIAYIDAYWIEETRSLLPIIVLYIFCVYLNSCCTINFWSIVIYVVSIGRVFFFMFIAHLEA
jgi:hypothetical protein